MENPFSTLMATLDLGRPVLIQTHDFPDHDALGAAYALSGLLERKKFNCSITYGGLIHSISLTTMISRLNIKMEQFAVVCGNTAYQTIVVDGSPAGGTVKTVAGTLVGVIDHHPARKKMICPFVDLRTAVGSCSAIIWTYWQEAGETPDKTSATALLAGIQLDTDFLSRRVSRTDLDAHYHLFFQGDSKLAREVVRTSLGVEQLPEIGRAFSSFYVRGSILLTEVHGDYSNELLSVLADFLLRLKEITFVVVIEIRGHEYHLSARTRDHDIDCGYITRKSLGGIGTGGGHPHMAGGVIQSDKYPGAEIFLHQIADRIAAYRSKNEANSQTGRD
jgi:nanoRNase/pAp phosphatase (c-di-AMP/oligoRNAs hydrolase)